MMRNVEYARRNNFVSARNYNLNPTKYKQIIQQQYSDETHSPLYTCFLSLHALTTALPLNIIIQLIVKGLICQKALES